MSLERSTDALASRGAFLGRVLRHVGVAGFFIGGGLAIGVLGYHFVAGLPWIDALLNASMILTGMGPVDVLKTDGAKLFASGYALMSGLLFITTAGYIVSPMLHRVLHRFHVESDDAPDAG
jgi:hypothetical protein